MRLNRYKYRSRSLNFGQAFASDDWAIDAAAADTARIAQDRTVAKTFVQAIEAVSTQVGSETDMQHGSLAFNFDEPRKLKSKKGADGKPLPEKYATDFDRRLKAGYGLPRTFEGEPSPDEIDMFETYRDDGFRPLGGTCGMSTRPFVFAHCILATIAPGAILDCYIAVAGLTFPV